MKSVFLALVISIVVVTALTPLVRVLALRLGAVSPSGGRHVHQRSIPRLGGLAIVAAFFAPLLLLRQTDGLVAEVLGQEWLRLLGLTVGGLSMSAVGVIDDTRGLRAAHKLVAQIAVA